MVKKLKKMVKKSKRPTKNFQLVNGLKGEGMSFIWSLVGKIVANGSRNSLNLVMDSLNWALASTTTC